MVTVTELAPPRPRGGRSITAAAKRIPVRAERGSAAARPAQRSDGGWQDEAWSYFDTVPEVKFAARFLGNCLSRLRFYPAIVIDPDQPPMPLIDAVGKVPGLTEQLARAADEEMARLDGGDGRAALQREYGVNLTITGEYNLIGRDVDGEEVWAVYSESAVTKSNDRVAIKETPGGAPVELADDDFVARVWRRHSRWPGLADSNMRAILDVCEEVLIYGRQFRAVGRSRNNAGVLLLPNELDFANERVVVADEEEPDAAPEPDIDESDEDELTPLERGIVDSLVTPTADDGSASQVVPHLLRGPKAALDGVRHISLDRKIDEQAIARIVHLISRMANGIDVPVEVLTGVADANHWTAWQIEDSTYKAHVEPLAQIPAAGTALVFLRPALLARSDDDFDPAVVRRIVLGIDPSALVVRPNRGADAKDAFDKKALSWDALRNYLGFSDADAPSSDELLLRYTLERSIGGMSLTRDLFNLVGYPQVPDAAEAVQDEAEAQAEGESAAGEPSGGTPPEEGGSPTPPAPSEPQASRTRELLRTLQAAASASSALGERLAMIDARLRDRLQLAASEALTAALARAGQRLRAQVQGDPALAELLRGVPNEDVGEVLGAASSDLDPASVLSAADFDGLHDRWAAWVADARREALEAARREAAAQGVDGDQFEQLAADELASADDDDDAGWVLLLAALLALGRARVFTPDGTPDDGEFDPAIAVPAGLVRDALARAGGHLTGDALGVHIGGGPASGTRMLSLLQRAGAVQVAWRWDVGMPSRPFPPHQALSGLVFTSFDAPELQHLSAFPAGGRYFPGDHRGCQCDAVPVLVWEGTTELVPGQRDYATAT